MATSTPPNSYLIVGAGCIGASTALHLKQLLPQADVTLVDSTPFPNPSAAAHDLNKIIRTDYDEIFYMKLALEALQMWKSDPLFNAHYHETGIVWAGSEKMSNKIMENYRSLDMRHRAQLLKPEDARTRWGGVLRDTNWAGLKQTLYNPSAGWGDAAPALQAVIQRAVDIGVRYNPNGVLKLLLHDDGECVGVQTKSGSIMQAGHTVLCTGAYTANLLADSAPNQPDLQVNGRLVAAAAIMTLYKVPAEELRKYEKAPVVINTLEHTQGESIPPGVAGLCKCTHEVSFTNIITHPESGQEISVPPAPISQSVWSQDVPKGLKDETNVVANHMYGRHIKGLVPLQYRMCWDAVTPTQDWIISPHPKAKGLYIAAGGSFHTWKFLPNIGAYVVKMLLGSLDEEKKKRWAWDRDNGGDGACDMYIPVRDLKDVDGYDELISSGDEAISGHWLNKAPQNESFVNKL